MATTSLTALQTPTPAVAAGATGSPGSNGLGQTADQRAAALLNLGGVSAADRVRQLAAALINTKFFPPGFTAVRQMAWEAAAYHNLRPYPYWQFADWKTEERGPLPRCLPLPRRIVNKGAKWLFGKPVQLSVPGNENLEKYLRDAWQKNKMPTHMVHNAMRGGTQGGIALKWSYDEEDDPKLSFQSLSVIDDCRLFYDPHDSDRLIMARIQYPVFNPEDGETYVYREEWTDEEEVHYRPVRAGYTNFLRRDGAGNTQIVGVAPVVAGTKTEPDSYGAWEILTRERNPFGVIPVWPIRNADAGGAYGFGDLWTDLGGGMFRVIDRINLTFHGMDKSNQFDSERNVIFMDVQAGPDQLDRPMRPGEPMSLKSDMQAAGEGKQGQVIELEASGNMRPHMMEYAQELRQEILATVGTVDVRHEEITNKGNLTQAVLTQIYAPLIETTEEKRKTYGEDGIAKFLERCALGLKTLGVKEAGLKGVSADREESYDVQLAWPDYFPLSEDEKTARVTRIDTEVAGGYNTRERAVEEIAKTEGIEDVAKLKQELAEVHDRMNTADKAAADMAVAQAEQAAKEAKAPIVPPGAPGGGGK